MRLEIFGAEPKLEPVIRLALAHYDLNAENEIVLRVVDENGRWCDRGDLLRISSKGVHRYRNINENLGFNLTPGIGRLFDLD